MPWGGGRGRWRVSCEGGPWRRRGRGGGVSGPCCFFYEVRKGITGKRRHRPPAHPSTPPPARRPAQLHAHQAGHERCQRRPARPRRLPLQRHPPLAHGEQLRQHPHIRACMHALQMCTNARMPAQHGWLGGCALRCNATPPLAHTGSCSGPAASEAQRSLRASNLGATSAWLAGWLAGCGLALPSLRTPAG